MALKQKILILRPYLVLAVIILLIIDLLWHVSGFEKRFRLSEIKPVDSNEELKSNVVISMHQIEVINRDSDIIDFTIWSEEEVKTFRLLDFKILYDDKEVKIKRNILYELVNDNPNSFKIINKQHSDANKVIYKYIVSGGSNNYKYCKINFKKVFWLKGMRLGFGDTFPVKIIVHFLLDDDEYFQELNFVCKCVEGSGYPPDWYMLLFPGAY